jgi:hypothetical protein
MAANSKEARKADRRAALDRAKTILFRAGAAAAIGLIIWGSLEVRARVRSDPRFNLSHWRLAIGDLPPWAPPELKADLEALEVGGTESEPLTIFTPRVLHRIRSQILASPWVREVREIHLRPPGLGTRGDARGLISADGPSVEDPAEPERSSSSSGSIDLVLDLRIPVAAVSAAGSYYLTDRDSVQMGPPLPLARARELGLPIISGGESRRTRRAPPPGSVWEDRDVREGLEVARVLLDEGIAAEFPAVPIEEIDISGIGDRARGADCEIVLVAGGYRLGWGRSPISSGARTLTVPEIVGNLRKVLRHPRECAPYELVRLYTNPPVGVVKK